MKYIGLILATFISLTACGDLEDRDCRQRDYIGTYFGSKEGALCTNDSNYVFEVAAGPESDQIVVDNNVMNFLSCDIISEGTTLGLGEEFEGHLEGDSIVVVQTAFGGFAELKCTWRGARR